MKSKLFWISLFLLGIPMGIFITKWLFLFSVTILVILGIDQFEDNNGSFLAFRKRPLKTIHSEYGKFYLYVKIGSGVDYQSTEAYVYVSYFWGFKRLTYFSFTGLEDLKSHTNQFLENHYGVKKRDRDFKNKIIKDIYKDWNGTTSKQIDRDKKLEDLIS